MDNLEEIIVKLRQIVDERHQAGMRAIDDLIASLAGPMLPRAPETNLFDITRNGSEHGSQVDSRSNVEKVLVAIGHWPKSVDEIAGETGLSEAQVRGVLYAKPVKPQVLAQRLNKKMRYITKAASARITTELADEVEDS